MVQGCSGWIVTVLYNSQSISIPLLLVVARTVVVGSMVVGSRVAKVVSLIVVDEEDCKPRVVCRPKVDSDTVVGLVGATVDKRLRSEK